MQIVSTNIQTFQSNALELVRSEKARIQVCASAERQHIDPKQITDYK